MRNLEKYFTAIFIYSLFFSDSWTGRNIWHWLSALLVSLSFIILINLFDFAIKGHENNVNNILNRYFIKTKSYKKKYLFEQRILITALVFVVLLTTGEFFMETVLFKQNPPISVGVPFSIYSFSASKFLPIGFFFDLLLYFATLRFIYKDL